MLKKNLIYKNNINKDFILAFFVMANLGHHTADI